MIQANIQDHWYCDKFSRSDVSRVACTKIFLSGLEVAKP